MLCFSTSRKSERIKLLKEEKEQLQSEVNRLLSENEQIRMDAENLGKKALLFTQEILRKRSNEDEGHNPTGKRQRNNDVRRERFDRIFGSLQDNLAEIKQAHIILLDENNKIKGQLELKNRDLGKTREKYNDDFKSLTDERNELERQNFIGATNELKTLLKKRDEEIKSLKDERNRSELERQNFDVATNELKTQLKKRDEEITSSVMKMQRSKDFLKQQHVESLHYKEGQIEKLRQSLKKAEELLVEQEELAKKKERTLREEINKLKGIDSNSKEEEIDGDPYVRKTLLQIEEVDRNNGELRLMVDNFRGTEIDKMYLDLDHKLLGNVMKIDSIQVNGHEIIRQKRKQSIKFAYECMEELKNNVVNEK